MARTSRKAIPDNHTSLAAGEIVYNTGVYGRLSVEDTRKDDSCSLDNQIYLLKQYVTEKPFMRLVDVYSDNGKSGTNFERPGFGRLMDDIRKGRINCIVVKDLSRFGRNYIETGNYLEKVFPFLNVRFIAINDDFDSYDPNCAGEGLVIALKNLINDVYSKDISQKSKSALHTKQVNGEFIGSYAPFGYMKSPANKNKLIINDETACVVRDIYRWMLEGMTLSDVTKRLNELGIPSPYRYNYMKGLSKNNRYADMKWQAKVVKSILTNIVYLGHMVNGKSKTIPEQGYITERLSQEQWIIVEHTHEAIVSSTDFIAVENIFRQTSAKYYTTYGRYAHLPVVDNILKGFLHCVDCGRKLHRVKNIKFKRDAVYYTFICRYCRDTANNSVKRKYIRETELIDAVYSSIVKEIELCACMESVFNRLCSSHEAIEKRQAQNSEITKLKQAITRINTLFAALYSDYCDGLFTESEYIYTKSKYERDKSAHTERLEELRTQQERLTPQFIDKNKWVAAYRSLVVDKALTREMLLALVDRIDITSDREISIIFKYRDEYECLASLIRESEAAAV